MALQTNKWEVKSRTWATGGDDYDGCWELTNGEITIATKDDDDIVEEGLKEAAEALNKSNAKFYQMEGKREIDLILENNDLYGKVGELKAENERLKEDFDRVQRTAIGYANRKEELENQRDSFQQQHQQLHDKAAKMAIAVETALAPRNLSSQGHISTAAMKWLAIVLSEYNQSKEGKEGKV